MTIVLSVAGAAVVLILLIFAVKARSLTKKSHRVFALVAMGLLPCLWLLGVGVYDLDRMMTVDFCVTCHTMDGYRESLTSEAADSIVAAHYMNNRVPHDKACYACHADHTPISGPIKTKLNGLLEAYIEYFGEAEMPLEAKRPETVLANCRHCHEGGKDFEIAHEDMLSEILSGETSCFECHDVGYVLPETNKDE